MSFLFLYLNLSVIHEPLGGLALPSHLAQIRQTIGLLPRLQLRLRILFFCEEGCDVFVSDLHLLVGEDGIKGTIDSSATLGFTTDILFHLLALNAILKHPLLQIHTLFLQAFHELPAHILTDEIHIVGRHVFCQTLQSGLNGSVQLQVGKLLGLLHLDVAAHLLVHVLNVHAPHLHGQFVIYLWQDHLPEAADLDLSKQLSVTEV